MATMATPGPPPRANLQKKISRLAEVVGWLSPPPLQPSFFFQGLDLGVAMGSSFAEFPPECKLRGPASKSSRRYAVSLERDSMSGPQLLLQAAAAIAFWGPPLNYQTAQCPATQRPALVMNARSGRAIPELAALYEVVPFMTYPGWECDVRVAEANWVNGFSTAASIKSAVETMRRKQRLHEGGRSDAVL